MSATQGQLVLNISITDVQDLNPYQNGFFQPTAVDAVLAQQVFADFGQRLQNIEWKIQAMGIGKDGVLSQIALSPEAILIESSKVGIVGEVTFADWLRDVNGVSTGVLDPSITTIRGGVIHTGIIYNSDNSNYLDLDATGSTPFLVSASGVTIKANGQFAFGSTAGNQLTFDGTNVALGGNTLLNGVLTSTVTSGASLGATAMQTNLANVLSGAGAVEYGSVSWSGGVASGTSAVAISANGIAGFSTTGAGFYISATTGNAVFTGNITGGANINITGEGIFGGATSSGPGTYAIIANSGYGANGGVIAYSNQIFNGAIMGYASGDAFGGHFETTGTQAALSCYTSGTGAALQVDGISNFLGSGINFGGDGHLYYFSGGTTTGTSTATFTSTNKPGSNSANSWITIKIDSTTLYIPVWT